MNILDKICSIIPPKEASEISIKEKYSSFEVNYIIESINKLKLNDLIFISDYLTDRDVGIINIVIEEDNPISYNFSKDSLDEFIKKVEDAKQYVEDNENVYFEFRITKNTSKGIITIFHFESFDKFIGSVDINSFLSILKEDLKKNNVLKFIVLDELEHFYSERIFFIDKSEEIKIESSDFDFEEFKDICHFGNYSEYPFNPNYFNLLVRPKNNNNITKKLDILASLFSIISIFDITYFKEGKFYYKLNGFKTFENFVNIDTFLLKSLPIYIKIVKWIYSESGNISDKIGLARNILSIYFKDDKLEVEESTYISILSAYKTYLKENLNKYIEIRNKISDQLISLTQSVNAIAENYLRNYQKSNITFISFFMSVFVLRVLVTGNFKNVFTRDATILSFALIFISLFYFIFSYINFNLEKNRLKERYKNLKIRFEDLLLEKDINNILRNDYEFNDEIKYINIRKIIYTILWILTILIFICAVLTVSDYFNWKNLFILIDSITIGST